MNVKQLHKQLTEALERGLDPETTVVAYVDGEWVCVDHIDNPLDHEDDTYIWFSLTPDVTKIADSRLDAGHYHNQ